MAPSLPILASRQRILYCIERYRTVIIHGETGSGKSTQIPQFLQQAGWTQNGFRVVCTQPRRIAASQLAARVAHELGSKLGDKVGYSVRFDRKESNETEILFATDGLLLRETMQDPLLTRYSVIMVDEAHERTVYTDILMGLLRKIRRKRPELRIIIASATLDARLFKRYMETNRNHLKPENDTACIVSVEGRQYPVETLYAEKPSYDYVRAAVETILNIHSSEPVSSGDILAFFPGQEDILQAIELLKTHDRTSRSLMLLPLYSGLPYREQLLVFKRSGRGERKCILATNIAETSVTIDGITYVVDTLFVKIPHYDPDLGRESLVVQPVSKAQARQRAGRAGRLHPGKCFRLCTEEAFLQLLDKQTIPEMQRTNMTWTVLQLKALGINDIAHFPFLSPPPASSFIRALEILYSLRAIDDRGNLTVDTGIPLVQFPVEPRLGAVLLGSLEMGCSDEILTIVSMLSHDSPFVNMKKASTIIRLLGAKEGDHLLMLNVYNHYLYKNRSKKWCYENGINPSIMARAVELRANLETYLKKLAASKCIPLASSSDPDTLLKCIARGFFANTARLSTNSTHYITVKDSRTVSIHPASLFANYGIPPQWVIYHEVTLTTSEFIRNVSQINPLWLTDIAPHYFQRPKRHEDLFAAPSQTSTIARDSLGMKRKELPIGLSEPQVKRSKIKSQDLERYLKRDFQF